MTRADALKLLGLKPGANAADIKAAYRAKQLAVHPDRHPNDPNANEKFCKLMEAYDLLQMPQTRPIPDWLLNGIEKGASPDARGAFSVLFGSSAGAATHDLFSVLAEVARKRGKK